MRYAIVIDGIVDNVIEAEQDFVDAHYPDAILLSDTDIVAHNYVYENGTFSLPIVPFMPEIIDAEVVEPTKAIE
jgi:hypothetical protein